MADGTSYSEKTEQSIDPSSRGSRSPTPRIHDNAGTGREKKRSKETLTNGVDCSDSNRSQSVIRALVGILVAGQEKPESVICLGSFSSSSSSLNKSRESDGTSIRSIPIIEESRSDPHNAAEQRRTIILITMTGLIVSLSLYMMVMYDGLIHTMK